MTGHRAHSADKGQLVLDLDAREHPAVERARALRRTIGLPESLTAAGVLVRVQRLLSPMATTQREEPAEVRRRTV